MSQESAAFAEARYVEENYHGNWDAYRADMRKQAEEEKGFKPKKKAEAEHLYNLLEEYTDFSGVLREIEELKAEKQKQEEKRRQRSLRIKELLSNLYLFLFMMFITGSVVISVAAENPVLRTGGLALVLVTAFFLGIKTSKK